MRGIATITSSVVARVVGARTLVASVAAAVAVVVVVVVVVVTNHEFSCLSMIIHNQLLAVFDKLVARPIQSWRFDCKWTHVPLNIHGHSHQMLFKFVERFDFSFFFFFFFEYSLISAEIFYSLKSNKYSIKIYRLNAFK